MVLTPLDLVMKKPKKLRIGIIGCGGISKVHAETYRDFEYCEIAQVFDVHTPSANALAKNFGAIVAASPGAMAASGNVDAVSICTPPGTHIECSLPFLKAGIPILCEKPLELNLQRAKKLATLVQQSHSIFMVAFCHRFHPAVLEARKLLNQGVIGTPLFFRNMFAGYLPIQGHRSDPAIAGGGALIDNGAHSVDLFHFLIGKTKTVQAFTSNLSQHVPVEDFGSMILKSETGPIGEIISSYSLLCADNRIEVFGEKGTLTLNYGIPGQADLLVRIQGKEPYGVDFSQRPDRFHAEIQHFLDCVSTRQTPWVTADDGLACAKVIELAYRSAKAGRRMSFSTMTPNPRSQSTLHSYRSQS
jgi:predicted dehydrogenase